MPLRVRAELDAEADEAEADEWLSLSRRLAAGRVCDSEFDTIYPRSVRLASSSFWTPVAVAARAVELLVRNSSAQVLDIGAGAGKFCIVGATLTGASFTGIEHRGYLVRTARRAAARMGIDRVSFVHGTLEMIDVTNFDAVYLFNPFEENLWHPDNQLDDLVELSEHRFLADIAGAEDLLMSARPGTRVVTYHGFGGDMPPGYRKLLREPCHTGHLELWVKLGGPLVRSCRCSSSAMACC